MESDSKESTVETIESLLKESETLKKRLEDERQKLNDVNCKFFFMLSFSLTSHCKF